MILGIELVVLLFILPGLIHVGQMGTRPSGNSQAAGLPLYVVFHLGFFMTAWPQDRAPNAQGRTARPPGI